MTNDEMITIVFLITAFTGLIVEAIKKMWKNASQYNALAGIVAIITTFAFAVANAIWKGIEVDSQYAIFYLCVAFMSWLSAMVGFDKVKQTIKQIEE